MYKKINFLGTQSIFLSMFTTIWSKKLKAITAKADKCLNNL